MAAVWSQQKVIDEIRNWHARGVGAGQIWRQSVALVAAAKYWFGSWRSALQAAEIQSVQQPWSQERVIEELHVRYAMELPAGQSRKRDRNLNGAARRYFGGWHQALVAAGLSSGTPPVKRVWTEQVVVDEILAWHARGVSVGQIWRQSRPLAFAAISRFGSWRAALRAAGLESARQQWSKERVVQELRSQFAAAGQSIRRRKWDSRLHSAAKRHFGSWHQALVAAKLITKPSRQMRTWTREQVIEAIRACQQQSAASLSTVHRRDCRLYSVAKRLFGSWREALSAAGCPPPVVRHWTRDEVIQEILDLHSAGKSLVGHWREYPQLFSAAKRLCGGWRNALNEAGIGTKPRHQWTKSRIIEVIRKRDQDGPPLSQVWQDDKLLFGAAIRKFGNWHNTLAAAGIESRPYQRWSKLRVIDALRSLPRQQPDVLRNLDPALAGAAYRFFGSTLKALDEAGLDPPPGRWTKQRVVQAIQDGHIRRLPIRKSGFGSIALALAAKRYFGSWRAAVSEAGLAAQLPPPVVTRSWSPQAVIDAIVSGHGQCIPLTELWKRDTGLYSAAKKHFGSWRAAVLAAGLETTRRQWTRELAIRELQAWYARSQSLSSAVLFRDNVRLGGAVIRLCGSWSAALAAAGLIAERPTPTTTKRRKGKKACSAKK